MLENTKRRRIGVFIEWLADGYSDPILDEIVRSAAQRDVDVLCFVGGCPRAGVSGALVHSPPLYASRDVIDGAVVVSMGNGITTAEIEQYFQRFEPIPLASVAVQWTRYPSVEVDNETGVLAGVRHLIRTHGRRKIACIRGPESSIEADKRFSAYRQALAEFGLEYDERLVTTGFYIREHGVDAVRLFLDERKREFDAIVTANDAMALGALDELSRRGIRVPEQVALLGFDDIDEGRHARPPLSTVRQPVREHGRRAFEVVLAQLDGKSVPQRSLIDSHLVLRRSCGCVTSRGVRGVSVAPDEVSRPVLAVGLEAWVKDFCEDLERSLVETGRPNIGCEKFTETMLTAAQSGDSRPFLTQFEQGLERFSQRQMDLLPLLPILDVKRQQVRGVVGAVTEQENLDALLRDASVLVSETAERTQAQLRYRAETQIDRLLRMNEALLQAMDFEQVAQVVSERLPQLGINGCYVCVFEGSEIPAEWARLVIACGDSGALGLPPGGLRFLAKEILPAGLVRSTAPSAWLVCPMLRREPDTTAYVVIVRGTAEAFVYDSLVDQIGSCFKRLALMKQVVDEVRLREQAERERIEKEMEIATRIQTGILPREVTVPGLEISCSMRPASEVGGDYYDVVTTDDGCWLGIGDVAGHGLPTGLVMLMCQSVLGGLVRSQPNGAPEEILAVANRLLYDNIRCRMQQDEHVTLALYRYRADGSLSFAGAHETALVWRARTQQVEVLETSGVWAGILEDIAPMTQGNQARLEPGDLFVLYTDGITEVRNSTGEVFGEERLAATICQFHDGHVSEIREQIFAAVFGWMVQQDDDMTVLVARYCGT